MLFWGEGFLNKLSKFLILAVAALFCWGWVSHVVLGRMTTGQYIRKLSMDFQQSLSDRSKKIREARDRITQNFKTWGQPGF
jgi:hypothetical protein